ncbi:MAG: hypothetical protein ACR2OO_08275 [Thermomicrobiales bacterium]
MRPHVIGAIFQYESGTSGMASGFLPSKDKLAARTPMRCPVCNGDLHRVMIRDLGGVSADLIWQLHAGECAEHGWFQCEVISRPPREIFAVDRPFGVARRMEIDGVEVYAFATVWDDAGPDVKRSRVDPFDPRYWQTRRQAYRL